jgi:hypothetical protein
MSAEYILDYSFDTLPNDPYIIPDKNYIEKYNRILFNNKTDKLKVGVRFRGNLNLNMNNIGYSRNNHYLM